jgi:hypothetical protein
MQHCLLYAHTYTVTSVDLHLTLYRKNSIKSHNSNDAPDRYRQLEAHYGCCNGSIIEESSKTMRFRRIIITGRRQYYARSPAFSSYSEVFSLITSTTCLVGHRTTL